MENTNKTIELSYEELQQISGVANAFLAKKKDSKVARAIRVKIAPQFTKLEKKYIKLVRDASQMYCIVDKETQAPISGTNNEFKFTKENQKLFDVEFDKILEKKVIINTFFTSPDGIDLEVEEIMAFKGIVIDPDNEICQEEYLLNPKSDTKKTDIKAE